MYSVQMTRKETKLQIDVESPVAVYRQIVDALRASLVEGELRPGEAHSIQRLARIFGIRLHLPFGAIGPALRRASTQINGIRDQKGGSVDVTSGTIADGMLFVTSGF